MLFGKNASAGVVSITTQQAKPGPFEALAKLEAGDRGRIDSSATLIRNRLDGRGFNGNDEHGAHPHVASNPHPALRVKPGLDASRQDTGDYSQVPSLDARRRVGVSLGLRF
jgi:iron complex outermembrane receptor protein